MKLVLVNPTIEAGDPPLGLAYLSSYLRKYSNFTDIVIVDKENPIRKIKKEKPDIVGFTAMTSEFSQANNLAGEIKKSFDIPIIIGGIHISSIPSHLTPSNFDIGIIGEGEQTLLELVQLYEKLGEFTEEELKKINGIIFNDNNKNIITESRKLTEPLDKIPFPARDLIKMKEYYLTPRQAAYGKFGIYAQMITSRGCPYDCVFCSPTRFWKKVRFHSAEYVVEEMKELIEKYKEIEGILIWDDLFIADKKRLEKIVTLIREEGINNELEFMIFGRVNLINENLCKLLKKMNVTVVDFGLESGSEKILKYLKRGTVTVEDNKRAVRLCKQFGIRTTCSFIIGSPGETEEDLKKTMDLVKNKNVDEAHVFQLTPLPGTVIWEYAKSKGSVSDDFNFDFSKLAVRGYKPNIILTEKMSKEKFKEWFIKFQRVTDKKNSKIKLKRIFSFKAKYFKYFLSKRFLSKLFNFLKYYMLSKLQRLKT